MYINMIDFIRSQEIILNNKDLLVDQVMKDLLCKSILTNYDLLYNLLWKTYSSFISH